MNYPPGCPVIIRDLSDPRNVRFVPVNNETPVPIENDFFKGVVMVKIRCAKPDLIPASHRAFFADNPRACFEVSVQGKFKRKNRGVLYMGAQLVSHMELPFFKRMTANLFLKLAHTFNRHLLYSLGTKAILPDSTSTPASPSSYYADDSSCFPSSRTGSPRSVVSVEQKSDDEKDSNGNGGNITTPPLYNEDDKRILFPHPSPAYLVVPLPEALDRLIVTPSSSAPPVLDTSMLPKNVPGYLDKKTTPSTHIVDLDATYSMSFFSQNWDFARWKIVNIPALDEMDAADFWGESPARVTAFELVPTDEERVHHRTNSKHHQHETVYFDPSLPHDCEHQRFMFNLEIFHVFHHKQHVAALFPSSSAAPATK